MPRRSMRLSNTSTGGLQIDHQVRGHRLGGDLLVDLAVQRELVGVQGQLREQPILLHHEIADPHHCEHVGLAQILELTHALEQEEELGRERTHLGAFVEAREERILLRRFEQRLPAQTRGQPFGKGGLAHTDRAFDHDVAEIRLGHLRLP